MTLKSAKSIKTIEFVLRSKNLLLTLKKFIFKLMKNS